MTNPEESLVPILGTTFNYVHALWDDNRGGSFAPWYSRRLVNSITVTGSINLSVIVEGFYNSHDDNMRLSDTVLILLRNSFSPYSIVDSSKSVIDSNSFTGMFVIENTATGEYYIEALHRNSIETWSRTAIKYIQGEKIVYDLTTSSAQAFGDNMIRVNNSPVRFAVYSGEVMRDGIVDGNDLSLIDNAAFNFATGYIQTDLTGDNKVDASDATIADNNAFNFISTIRP